MSVAASADVAISNRLGSLIDEAPGSTVTLGWILDRLHERAFGLFLMILALPCCIPFLYGIPQIVSLPLLFVSGQMVLARSVPWLPARLRARAVTVKSLSDLLRRAGPWLRRIEALCRPRLGALTRVPFDRIVGLFLVIFSASIMVPLPATNTVPGFAVLVVSIGLVQRDGLFVIAGCVVGSVWIATLLIAGASLASVVGEWIGK